ncbi:MAG TPA: hypothetical protein DCY27_01965, partial [Desulfobacterales bacterium]|nr:hypothetical protein [Desulfobacterales bacterium]
GNTVNIWQSGYASGCVLGPNHVINGTDEIYGKNILISNSGAITAPALASAKQVVAFNASYNVNLALGAYIVTPDIGNAAAVTVNAPANPTTGQEVIFDWTKSANPLTINWNAAFKTSYATMSASKRVVIRFLYDGTHYIQVGTPVELTP